MTDVVSSQRRARAVATTARRPASSVERAALAVAVTLFASGLLHLVILVVSRGTWIGPRSWRKAASFGTSFGLTLAAVTWAGRLRPRTQAWTRLLATFSAACALETGLVSLQVWRDVPSHFNLETSLDTTISTALAAGGGVLVLCGLGFTALTARAADSPPVLLASLASFVTLLAGFAVGVAMVATGARLARGGQPGLAYTSTQHLKPLHAVLLHGIVVLFPVPWFATRLSLDERQQLRCVQASLVAYAALAAAVAWPLVR